MGSGPTDGDPPAHGSRSERAFWDELPASAPLPYSSSVGLSDKTRTRLELIAAGAMSAGLYMSTACSFLLGGDAGEFAALGTSGGVAHPPGYPLYLLWMRALSWLPAQNPAHRTSLATAILGGAAVAAFAWACLRWGVRKHLAYALALLFALSPLFWKLATQPEVFALNTLLALMLVGGAAPTKTWPTWALGLLAGLGLSNQHTIVLLAPLGVAAAIHQIRASNSRWLALATGVLGLLLGLLPYTYLVYYARTTPTAEACSWGSPSDFGSLLQHFLRTNYGTTRLAISDAKPEPLLQLAFLGRDLALHLATIPVIALGVAVALWAKTKQMGPPNRWVLFLAASFIASGPLFASISNLAPRGLTLHIVERFHLLPSALALLLSALALERLAAAQPKESRVPALLAALLVVSGVTRGVMSWDEVSEAHRPTTDYYLRNVLQMAPPNTVLVSAGDDIFGASLYKRCALRVRPDVEIVNPRLLLGSWYPEQVSARLGLPVLRGTTPPGGTLPALSLPALLEQLASAGHPVFVNDAKSAAGNKLFSYPVGPLIRILLDPKEIPSPDDLFALNERIFTTLAFEPTPPELGTWAGARMADYARPYLTLGEAFATQGNEAKAAYCRQKANEFMPR